MVWQICLLLLGFLFLIKGADYFVDGSSCIARHFHISKMFVGLTIVAFGTSAPEFAVSIQAMLSGSSDIVLGNVIGSNIANILLILGIAAVIFPIKIKHATIRKEIPLCILTSILLVVCLLDGVLDGEAVNQISRSDGLAILLYFAIFLYYLFSIARNKVDTNPENDDDIKYGMLVSVILTVVGLGGIIFGSDLVVDSSTVIATKLGISQRIISLTIVAIGTSLPELVTTVVSSIKREQDILVGNIIGSNIFNICFVLGLPVSLFGTLVSNSFTMVDIVALIGSSVLLFICSITKREISRLEGMVFLLGYVLYYVFIFAL